MAKQTKAAGNTASQGSGPKPVEVVLRKPHNVEGKPCERGHSLGVVKLAPGVSLNFFVDAIRNGIAGEKNPE